MAINTGQALLKDNYLQLNSKFTSIYTMNISPLQDYRVSFWLLCQVYCLAGGDESFQRHWV